MWKKDYLCSYELSSIQFERSYAMLTVSFVFTTTPFARPSTITTAVPITSLRPTLPAVIMQVDFENISAQTHSAILNKKTPPDGEKGGEKQYKDYEKNPTLFFLNASASKSDAKISIIFIHGTLLDIFLEIFPIFYPIRVQNALFRPRWSRVHAPAITAWRP